MTTLKGFINKSRRGDEFIYHVGDLARDRKDNPTLNEVAHQAMDFFQRGFLELCQRRLGDNSYEYVAVRTTDVGRRPFTGCYAQDGE